MKRLSVSFLLIVVLSVASCFGSDAPVPSVKLCKPDEPNLAECWKVSIAQATLGLMNGIPSMNFPSIYRLYVPSYKIKAKTVSIDLKNLFFVGVHNFDLIDLVADPESNSVDATVLVSELSLESDVVSRGRYDEFSVAGSGKITVVIKNMVVYYKIQAEIFTENEHTYHHVDGETTEVEYDSVEIKQQDVLEDPKVIAALKERIQDKSSAFHEHFLQMLKKTFIRHLSQYGMRAHNQLPEARE